MLQLVLPEVPTERIELATNEQVCVCVCVCVCDTQLVLRPKHPQSASSTPPTSKRRQRTDTMSLMPCNTCAFNEQVAAEQDKLLQLLRHVLSLSLSLLANLNTRAPPRRIVSLT